MPWVSSRKRKNPTTKPDRPPVKTETIVSIKNPLGSRTEIVRQTFPAFKKKPKHRISFVSGLHGDELEGLYLFHLLIQGLQDLQERDPEAFIGEINIYPAVNPPALHSTSRLWPFYSLDMNRTIGQANGRSIGAQATQQVFDDIVAHSDYAVDIHASNLHLMELPQVRIVEEFFGELMPLGKETGTDLVWIHPMAGLFESTLGYNLNKKKIPTLVIETGICLRIHPEFIQRLYKGMMRYLHHLGILSRTSVDLNTVPTPRVIYPTQVALMTSGHPGLFVSSTQLGAEVSRGDVMGQMIDPVGGQVLEDVLAPATGLLFTLRQMPLTYSGALLGRIALDTRPES